MKRFFLFLASWVVVMCASAQGPTLSLRLYPEGPAQSNGLVGDVERLEGGRVANVSNPWMDVYLAPNSNGKAVVICPGGGYVRLAANHEGHLFAEWLAQRGISSVVLHYRMPNGHSSIPLEDVLTAIEIVRQRAEEWHIDPAKVGVMGFSAGGHLAATAVTKFTTKANRPDFGVLIYPVISMKKEITHLGSRRSLLGEDAGFDEVVEWSAEERVTLNTPPCFLALSDDDKSVNPLNSVLFYNALKIHRVPAELHIYPAGGHGWGFNGEKFAPYHDEFLVSLDRWLGDL